ncbi:hypothetical protein D3C85_1080040 [compost metagenome]
MQVVHGMRILFAEDRHQNVGAGDFFLAGGLHVQDGALDHALEAERGLGFHFVVTRDDRGVFVDEIAQLFLQLFDIGAACAQHFGSRRIVCHRQQQMLNADEFMPLAPCLHKCHVQAYFQFLGNHQFSSMTHCSGCWCARACCETCSTLVAATSLV